MVGQVYLYAVITQFHWLQTFEVFNQAFLHNQTRQSLLRCSSWGKLRTSSNEMLLRDEIPYIHQALLRLVSQGDALARLSHSTFTTCPLRHFRLDSPHGYFNF
jgi:hypothetical protein